jgi:hypothetical protein
MSAQDGNDHMPSTAREEAERLVAAGLAAVSMAADRIGAPSRERGGAAAVGFDALGDALFGPSSHRRHSIATDSAECCRCPLCRVISAARHPDPEFTERLATGVGDLAEGAARMLGTLTGTGIEPGGRQEGNRSVRPADDVWAAATEGTGPAAGNTDR